MPFNLTIKYSRRLFSRRLVIAFMFFSIMPPGKIIKVYLVGDSTMAGKQVEAYPETGWGMPFTYFFDSTVVVENRAVNGRSTKTFLSENRWQPIAASLQEGDYVLIQFGHNDEVETKASYTTPDAFTANLTRYISETRSRKAIPVLITPVARRKFDSSGNVVETHAMYAGIVRSVALKLNAPLIDLDRKSQQLLQQFGKEPSKNLFNWLEPGEHPNYPGGSKDDTHFNELGARRIAELVLAEIKAQHLELAGHIIIRSPK